MTERRRVLPCVGVLFGLSRAAQAAAGLKTELVAASLVAVATSWMVVHCVFGATIFAVAINVVAGLV